MTSVRYHLVDAFSDRPFGGNPAGVCLLERTPGDAWMAAVAAELNMPETAFTWTETDGTRRLRWWTPVREVPLCGHATLAAAHALAAEGEAGDGDLVFETASGRLTARVGPDGVELDFPALIREEVDAALDAAVRAAVVAPVTGVARYGPKLLAEVDGDAGVDAGITGPAAVAALDAEGLVVTGRTPQGYSLRYFAPAVGLDEDAVTGSAQCAAAPWWHDRDRSTQWSVVQRSARGGQLQVRLAGDRVRMAGRAVSVASGQLLVGPEQ